MAKQESVDLDDERLTFTKVSLLGANGTVTKELPIGTEVVIQLRGVVTDHGDKALKQKDGGTKLQPYSKVDVDSFTITKQTPPDAA